MFFIGHKITLFRQTIHRFFSMYYWSGHSKAFHISITFSQ